MAHVLKTFHTYSILSLLDNYPAIIIARKCNNTVITIKKTVDECLLSIYYVMMIKK